MEAAIASTSARTPAVYAINARDSVMRLVRQTMPRPEIIGISFPARADEGAQRYCSAASFIVAPSQTSPADAIGVAEGLR